MTNDNASVPFSDDSAVTMFYTCALDLLAQTEAQHRAVVGAQTRLEACLSEWRLKPPTTASRHDQLSLIAGLVRDVVVAVGAQQILATDMQKAVAALQANEAS